MKILAAIVVMVVGIAGADASVVVADGSATATVLVVGGTLRLDVDDSNVITVVDARGTGAGWDLFVTGTDVEVSLNPSQIVTVYGNGGVVAALPTPVKLNGTVRIASAPGPDGRGTYTLSPTYTGGSTGVTVTLVSR